MASIIVISNEDFDQYKKKQIQWARHMSGWFDPFIEAYNELLLPNSLKCCIDCLLLL